MGFESLRLIGVGGFSSVWAATEILFGRRVAMKVIDATGAQRRRLEREARALGQLAGLPNVIQPYSVTTAVDGRLVLVLPLLETSLSERIEFQGAQSIELVTSWAGDLAVALDEAHRRGVSHRDIKPENVLFDASGAAYLADFGIAAMEGTPAHTVTAMSLSPVHAPPERFGPSEPDPTAGDRWSFASTVFTAAAGSPPFGLPSDGGLVGLMNRICHADVSSSEALPDEIIEVFRRGLAKDPAGRFGSAGEFVAELRLAVSSSADRGSGSATRISVAEENSSAQTVRRDAAWRIPERVTAAPLDLEYDCSDWNEWLRERLGQAVQDAGIDHEWEGPRLSVSLAEEDFVDSIVRDVIDTFDVSSLTETIGSGDPVVQLERLSAQLAERRFTAHGVLDFVALCDQLSALPPPNGADPVAWASARRLATLIRDQLQHEEASDSADSRTAMLAAELRGLLSAM